MKPIYVFMLGPKTYKIEAFSVKEAIRNLKKKIENGEIIPPKYIGRLVCVTSPRGRNLYQESKSFLKEIGIKVFEERPIFHNEGR